MLKQLDLHVTFTESLNGRIAERSMLPFSATFPLSFIATGFCRATSVVGLSFERTCGPMSGSPKIRRLGNTSFSGRVTHRETFGDYSKSQVEDDFGLPLFSNNTKKLPFPKVTMLRNFHDISDKLCFQEFSNMYLWNILEHTKTRPPKATVYEGIPISFGFIRGIAWAMHTRGMLGFPRPLPRFYFSSWRCGTTLLFRNRPGKARRARVDCFLFKKCIMTRLW